MSIPPCSHLMSNHDGALVVGDGAPHNTGDIQLNDPFIWVFDVAPERRRPFAATTPAGKCWMATVR
jgi:oligogalacturonide lyase